MRRGTPLLLVAVLLLAGCLSPSEGSDLDPEPDPTSDPGPPEVERFDNAGEDAAEEPPSGNASTIASRGPDPVQTTWGTRLTGFRGAEPTMGITSEGSVLMVALEDTLRSTDDGETWTSVLDFADVGPIDDRITADPYLWVDATSDRIFTLHMVGLYCTYLAYSDDGGETWTGRDGQCGTPVVDHPKLGSAPAPVANPAAGIAFPSVLYQCYNTPAVFGFVFRCSMSYDGGETFPVTTSPFNTAEGSCSALGGVTAGRSDGTVAMAGGYRCGTDAHSIAMSSDGGLTWTTSSGPSLGAQSMDPDIAFGPDDALWLAWRGDDERLHLARSHDLAQTWDGPWGVTPPSVATTAFEAVAVREDGAVATAFLGTNATGPPGQVGPDAHWYLYATTWDAATDTDGPFVSYRLSDDPVHVGGICYVNQPCEDGGRNLLEFIDAQIAPDGTLYVAYTESCLAGCDDDPSVQADDVREAAVGWLRDW